MTGQEAGERPDGRAQCVAYANEPPWYLHTHRCERPASTEVGGHEVCGTHARVARRWLAEDRLDAMVASYWRQK